MENKQTAIQIAIESYQNDGVSFTDWFMDNSYMLLAMEKEQIKYAHLIGLISFMEMEATKQAEQYYEENYGK